MHEKTYKVQIFGNYYKAPVGYTFECRVFFEGIRVRMVQTCTVTSESSVIPVEDIVEEISDSFEKTMAFWKMLFKGIESHVTPTAVHEG